MILDWSNKDEAIKVLRYLGVSESTIKYLKCTEDGEWIHKFERWLGGRDGWSSLFIMREDPTDKPYEPGNSDYDPEEDEKITVDGIDYYIHEGD